MIVTIDGPSSSGKSTVARALAKKLQLYYLNTGFLYRAVAYLLKKECNYDAACFDNPQDKDLRYILDRKRFAYRYDPRVGEMILFDGSDISYHLKKPDIASGASVLGVHPIVRESLLAFQQELGQENSLVVEGRDTGSVIFPNADLKFFLTADRTKRAERWFNDETRKEKPTTLEEVITMIAERDKRDEERTVSPLVVPEGAIVIDNTDMNLQETLEAMLAHITESTERTD